MQPIDPTQPGQQDFEGESFSCYVRVQKVAGEDFGAVATLAYEQNGGIDVSLDEPVQVQITEDAAQIVQPNALLRLTLSKIAQ